MNTAFVVEIRVNGKWLSAQRVSEEFYPTEMEAIKAAKENYPITCRIQASKGGPVGIRVLPVELVTQGD